MNKLKEYFNSLNLQNKLRLCFIFLILLPSLTIGIAYYGVSYHSIIDIAKKNILDVVVKNTQLIDRQMSYIQESAVNFNVDADMYSLLSDVDTVPDSELLIKDKKIQAVLQKYFVDDDIVTTTVMTEKFIFGDNSQLKVPVNNFFSSALLEGLREHRGEAQWVPTYVVKDTFGLDYAVENPTVYSMIQPLNPTYIDPEKPSDTKALSEDFNAVLVISFRDNLIREMFESSNSVENSQFCISSMGGEIVSHSDSSKAGTTQELPWLEHITDKTGNMVLRYQGEKMLVCYEVSQVTGWVFASITPVRGLVHNVISLQMLTVFLGILIFILAMLVSKIFARKITLPIEKLVGAMKQVGKGDFSVRLATNGRDELQYLTEKYNDMSERIQILIEENYESEIRNRESEIMALNLQMNPHFLYNTLNIINMMALEEGNEEISRMLLCLSDMLQYTFRNKQELAAFSEEYLWLQNYLHIMEMRFEGKFKVVYEVERELGQYKVPKLLLQPLVENAVVHGFRDMKSGGCLYIRGAAETDAVILEVEDNGCGMSGEEIEKAMHGDYHRIGLENTQRRIQLLYGERGSMQIMSEPGKGTRIRIRIPLQEKEKREGS